MPAFADDLDDHDIRMVAAFLRQQRFAKPDFKIEPPAAAGEDAPAKPAVDEAADKGAASRRDQARGARARSPAQRESQSRAYGEACTHEQEAAGRGSCGSG